jgi:hypothetical protein
MFHVKHFVHEDSSSEYGIIARNVSREAFLASVSRARLRAYSRTLTVYVSGETFPRSSKPLTGFELPEAKMRS